VPKIIFMTTPQNQQGPKQQGDQNLKISQQSQKPTKQADAKTPDKK
jgi:hypothetical protein